MSANHHPNLGLIEGFFGRQWSWEARHQALVFLQQQQFGFYLYAPKGDACLRRHWQDPWPTATLQALHRLRAHCRDLGLAFGVGLSPLELYRQPAASAERDLRAKIRYLNQLEPDILCLLFDDMRGDLPGLARSQAALADCAAEYTSATRLILCPTYYSYDPVLEKVFGQRPAHYWEELGQLLDARFDIFWTGPRVCSEHYPAEHLREVSALLQRKPFLWDNYPVNDSSVKSRHLLLRGVPKSHSALREQVAGHAANPMNQPWLSRLPLYSLAEAYRKGSHYDPALAFTEACRRECSPPLAEALGTDLALFHDQGLGALSATDISRLLDRYQHWSNEPCAREVIAWLQGEYAFDPACLTE